MISLSLEGLPLGGADGLSRARRGAGGTARPARQRPLAQLPGKRVEAQAAGVVSYPVPLKEKDKVEYRNETQSLEPKAPCLGSPNEPVAEAGWTCVYRGGNFGSQEAQDKNVKFSTFEDALGNELAPKSAEGGKLGDLVVFRTNEFGVESAVAEPLANPAYLVASGSWAVTAK